jgi:hypothetical protein
MKLFDDFVVFRGGRNNSYIMTPFMCEYVSAASQPR